MTTTHRGRFLIRVGGDFSPEPGAKRGHSDALANDSLLQPAFHRIVGHDREMVGESQPRNSEDLFGYLPPDSTGPGA
jgi:hypothetical protein